MYKLRNLLGLQVIEVYSGNVLGEVMGVFLDIDKASIVGIEIGGKIPGSGKNTILFENIYAIGCDAVMIRDFNKATDHQELPQENIISADKLVAKRIISEAGVQLGIIVDIYFDSNTGELKRYELSESLITDLLYGRLSMPLPNVQVIGDENIVVPESMVKLLHAVSD